jgi:hypothetical protein
VLNTKQTGRRVGSEWYECDRCGNNYPRASVIVQQGLVVCSGGGTLNCFDQPGRDYFTQDLETGYEETPSDLPQDNETI